MAQPSEADIKKKVDYRDGLLKSLSCGKLPDKDLCQILRSNVRRTWMMSPIRLLKLETTRIADMDTTTRTKWLWECVSCNDKFKGPDVQVDHIVGEHKLSSLAHIEQFARSILDVKLDDLQIMCKGCHGIKSYAEKHEMTFDDASIEKQVIAWQKDTKVPKQKSFLGDNGYDHHNHNTRRDSYRKYLNS
jgi:5-methylcytosine-specific restriction endonuclease McrA